MSGSKRKAQEVIDLCSEDEQDEPSRRAQPPSPPDEEALLKERYQGKKRLLKERSSFAQPGIRLVADRRLEPGGKFSHEWTAELEGTHIYAGELFWLRLRFPQDYPLHAPETEFKTDGGRPSPCHEHIYSNGHICLDLLYSGWSPAVTASSVCISIQSMMASAESKKRPPGDQAYCNHTKGRSSKETKWAFHDNKC